ncbi:MAG: 2Fe-2S iron-sulfur cluster binding domain-containing protein [Deltaproteobacteria bacterium]|nr:2Fe-2S iron-sulfur cluster binding domain-containing protein [Deltaproteobacteria bacterium]
MPVVTIDSRQVDVEPGTTILKAALKLGIDIPVFCYHDGLPVAANCRMCLVEVKGSPKPLPACEVQVRDGMEVLTRSQVALDARKAVLELILLNHPVDCPICDQAGECVLQDHYFEHSATPSRIQVSKVHKAKAVPLGPNVMLDRERCINCTRCVRFCREVSGSRQLTQVHRGNHTEIAVFPGRQFDDPYSLCAVDLCPVGALTSRDFRFRQRAWSLESSPAICPECSRGCNVLADAANGRLFRIRPRNNPDVNRWWACDHGRLAFRRFEERRADRSLVDYKPQPPTRQATLEAADVAAGRLQAIRSNGGRILLVLSSMLSLEEGFAALRFASSILGEKLVLLAPRGGGTADSLLRTADSNANRSGLTRLAAALGLETADLAGFFASPSAAEVAGLVSAGAEYEVPPLPAGARISEAVAFSHCLDAVADKATVLLPIPGHFEKDGHYANCDGRVQRSASAIAAPEAAVQLHVLLSRIASKMSGTLGYGDMTSVRSAALSLSGTGEGSNA